MNMPQQYDDLPWDLILDALSESLSPMDEASFKAWLEGSKDNRRKFFEIKQIWENEVNAYELYSGADETRAWELLRSKMGNTETAPAKGTPIYKISFVRKILAVAAVLLLIVLTGRWYFSKNDRSEVYMTEPGEHKKLSLPDGSVLILNPQSSIRVESDQGAGTRTVFLNQGEVFFEVTHIEKQPFTVMMEGASIQDIGTSFTVLKTRDSIRVIVYTGRVVVRSKQPEETREISAGESTCLFLLEHHFGPLKSYTIPDSLGSHLQFDNAPLPEVIAALEKMSGKTIRLGDSLATQKRLTAKLEGQTLDRALQVICTSLDLVLTHESGVYLLKSKNPAAHH
jgi:transmembrane sensor